MPPVHAVADSTQPTPGSTPAAPSVEDLLTALGDAASPAERARIVDEVVHATLPLADSLAARYAGRGIDSEDLTQVARTALVAAVHRYRPDAGRPFTAFAVPTIRGELKRHFRDAGWMVRPPRGMQELRAEVVRAEEDLRHHLGRNPQPAEVAEVVGRSTAEVYDARGCASAFSPGSLDAPTPMGGTVGDLLAAPGDAASDIELRAAVRAELARLSPRERLIVCLRFEDERTQSEIGKVVGVSQMQVSRLLAQILRRLRDGLDPATAA